MQCRVVAVCHLGGHLGSHLTGSTIVAKLLQRGAVGPVEVLSVEVGEGGGLDVLKSN